jgi:RimJ/RimL family protein N-acetyltransferase
LEYGFKTLKLSEVYAIILTENVRSRGVLQKLGMVLEKGLLWHKLPAELWKTSTLKAE